MVHLVTGMHTASVIFTAVMAKLVYVQPITITDVQRIVTIQNPIFVIMMIYMIIHEVMDWMIWTQICQVFVMIPQTTNSRGMR